jgi:hypothetical protein
MTVEKEGWKEVGGIEDIIEERNSRNGRNVRKEGKVRMAGREEWYKGRKYW